MIFALLRAQASRRGSGVRWMTAAEPPKGRSPFGQKEDAQPRHGAGANGGVPCRPQAGRVIFALLRAQASRRGSGVR